MNRVFYFNLNPNTKQSVEGSVKCEYRILLYEVKTAPETIIIYVLQCSKTWF